MPDEPNPTEDTPTFELNEGSGGQMRLRLSGRLDAAGTSKLWSTLQRRFTAQPAQVLEIDTTDLTHCDGAGIALLQYLGMSSMTPGAAVTVNGLRPEWQRMYDRFSREDLDAHHATHAPRGHVATDVGRAVVNLWEDVRDQIQFLGSITLAALYMIRHPGQLRWMEVLRVFEKAGANALPIVSLISLLVGLIIAFESAQPLRLFGAEIFIVDMIGLVMVRELGPLMTAILLAGRSGSAFAAELGTMKVNEELNALETMGLDPIRFLIIQRVIASLILTPLLTLHAMLMGVLGGVFVMMALGFSTTLIWIQLTGSLKVSDILRGL